MPKNLSVEEIKAVAEAAIRATQKVTDAKKALEDAGGEDDTLKAALAEAEREATEATAKSNALTHQPPVDTSKKIQKLRRKKGFIDKELRDLGVEIEDEDDDDAEEEDDDSQPLTRGDLRRIEAEKAKQTAVQMADAIEDAGDKAAVKDALARIVPSGDPEKDLKAAVAIANADRNSRVLEEFARRPFVRTHPTSPGAGARREEPIVLTQEEKGFMRAPFNMTEKEIIAARQK